MFNVDLVTRIDIITDICKILMESGVGTTQIEAYLNDLFEVFSIKEPSVFAIPRYVQIAYVDDNNRKVTALVRCKEPDTNLGNIERTCKLITALKEDKIALNTVYKELEELHREPDGKWWIKLLSYIGVSVSFTLLTMGLLKVQIYEAVAILLGTIYCSIILYAFDVVLSRANLSDIFAKIISSLVLMLSVVFIQRILSLLNIKLYTAYVLFGNIALLVPGEKITNGIRDMLSGNALASLIQIFESIVTTAGIAFAIYLIQNLMKGTIEGATPCYYIANQTWTDSLYIIVLTGVGTLLYSVRFHLNRPHLILSFISGALTYTSYLLVRNLAAHINSVSIQIFLAYFAAGCIAEAITELIVHKKNWPSMVILFPSLATLIPGSSLYGAIYSIFSDTYSASDVNVLIYGVAGLALGILIATFFPRVVISFIDSIDKQSAEEVEVGRRKANIKKIVDKGWDLYKVARRLGKNNPKLAYEFYKAADKYFGDALSDIDVYQSTKSKTKKHKTEKRKKTIYNENLIEYEKYEANKGRGLNKFWIYKIMDMLDIGNVGERLGVLVEARAYCTTAKNIRATNLKDPNNNRELAELFNWMGVIIINEVRVANLTKADKLEKLHRAESEFGNAHQYNPRFLGVYINNAEVAFSKIGIEFGFTFGQPILPIRPKNVDRCVVETCFKDIEENLKIALILNPSSTNSYYKMAQLQTYKIFYARYVLGLKNTKCQGFIDEAEKWFNRLPFDEKKDISYLNVYREFLELTDLEMAKQVNEQIRAYSEKAANKWLDAIEQYLKSSKKGK